MKKIITLIIFIVSIELAQAQNQTSMYLSGDFNTWNVTSMSYRPLGVPSFKVSFQYNGTTGIQEFKFRDSGDNWDNQWGRGDNVNMAELTTWFSHGDNGKANLTNGKYYTFIIKDVNDGVHSEGYVFETTNMPVSITNVQDDYSSPGVDVNVDITCSALLSPEEHLFVRYTKDNWTTSSLIEATFNASFIYRATIPGNDVTGTTSNNYYVFTTGLSTPTGSTADLATINYENNGDSNFPLPVELTSFAANILSDGVELNWQTATEVNNYGFDVQRSTSSDNWLTLGFVAGNGNSNSPKEYSFVDEDIKNQANGKYYYRLKQIDTDGSYSYSSEIEVEWTNGVTDVNDDSNLPKEYSLSQNYPNPFNPTTKIKYAIPTVGNQNPVSVKLKVYDILGNEISTLVNEVKTPGEYEVEFNGKGLSSGMYFYKIEAGNFVRVNKMILMK